jgi:hypothetical protein
MKDVTREQRCRVFEGIIWVWLTGGRVVLNLLEEPFHQHRRTVSVNIPRGGKQEKSPSFPLLQRGMKGGFFKPTVYSRQPTAKIQRLIFFFRLWLLAVGCGLPAVD